MSQRSGQKRNRPPSSTRSILRLSTPDGTNPPPAKKQKVKSLTSIARPPTFNLTASHHKTSSQDVRSKGKMKETIEDDDTQFGHQLWVDRYEPLTEEDLAVNKRKIQEVRQWLMEAFDGGPSGKLRKYRRILALTGPAGTGKTAAIRVLARELNCDLLEWRNSMDEQFTRTDDFVLDLDEEPVEYEGLADKFRTFLTRASSCHTIFSTSTVLPGSQTQSSQATVPSRSHTPELAHSTSTGEAQAKRQIILLEDLPNVLHPATQAVVHAALQTFAFSHVLGAPLVLIISDTGFRGEDPENDAGGWRRAKEIIDIRTVLPPSLLNSPSVTQIGFRSLTPTFLRKALQNLLNAHYSSASGSPPSKDVLDAITESSNGDIRSAVMTLQFACTADTGKRSAKGTRKKRGGLQVGVLMEVVTRREQSLALFHLLGKILYNKRKGDPESTSASAKDIQRDRMFDAQLRDPPPLPTHLQEHHRRASRVDVDTLYADSPIDASLLSLYVQQNYTQYCNTLDECAALADWLSYIDSSGGETWHQANPHHFHLVTLSALHSLPSPVVRRNQKAYKPAFFQALQREHEAEDGVRDVQEWLRRDIDEGAGTWSRREIALELGAVLRMRDFAGVFDMTDSRVLIRSNGFPGDSSAPSTHRSFSRLDFVKDVGGLAQLTEDGKEDRDHISDEDDDATRITTATGDREGGEDGGGWLEGDDIEDF
ncbi:uncharacterized protein FIBRA_05602 [Fibroporia radiculosa]|uniref:AAA+ ATPase domain-containing protein n=1 Tax=Fibroporia radiculosa TaxID=599839 RepID=J4H3L8_9APHY|nr:uncharacterized protein FIBRA_05602 [Fibroporia radiculosa]CCM03469.1 predicted protein [Fibroporia radiculosa]